MNNNIEYHKECFENNICPKCNEKLDRLIGVDGLLCKYCDEVYYPLEEPYNMEFDRIFW